MKKLPLLLVLLLVALLAAGPFSAGPIPRPNILVILTDDQGRDDYSAAGTSDLRTPNIDRLMNEGATGVNFYANSPVCSPSRAALLSGCYPDRVGVPGVIRDEGRPNHGYLLPSTVLVPQLLTQAGYECAGFGKWHLGAEAPDLPTAHGFSLFRGFLGDMLDDYVTHKRHKQPALVENGRPINPKGHATDLFTDWACQFIDQHAHSPSPYFLYLAYNAPHTPVQPPDDWIRKVREREPNLPVERLLMVALLEHMDAGIGRVLDTLHRTGQDHKTLVLFASDNGGLLRGGANNGHWRGGKGALYEGGLRVPMAARWPGYIAPKSQLTEPAMLADLFPTICEAAGVNHSHEIDGVSLLPALRQHAHLAPRDLYFVIEGQKPGQKPVRRRALRRGDWKLVDNGHGALELYDLKTDPRETRDESAAKPALVQELSAALAAHARKAEGFGAHQRHS